jgi:hypothetical protein
MFLLKRLIPVILFLMSAAVVYSADITGKWAAEFDSQVGVQKYVFELKAEGAALTGKAVSKIGAAEAQTPIKEGKINGDEVSFVENLTYEGMELRIVYKGKVSGDEIKFSRTVADAGGEEFVAKRVK